MAGDQTAPGLLCEDLPFFSSNGARLLVYLSQTPFFPVLCKVAASSKILSECPGATIRRRPRNRAVFMEKSMDRLRTRPRK